MTELPQPDLTLDTSGKFCPMPVLEISRAMQKLQSGQVVELVATDPGVESDMPAWCKATRNQFLGLVKEGRTLRAFIRKS